MTSWRARKHLGDAHEARVAYELNARGWAVDRWGQAVIADAVTTVLRRTDSSLRWTPDFLAARHDTVVMIDCKARMTSRLSRRHAVEQAAARAHRKFAALHKLPLYYVFDNLDVLTPLDVLGAGRPGPQSRVGSGTPYFLVSMDLARTFDDVFGTVQNKFDAA